MEGLTGLEDGAERGEVHGGCLAVKATLSTARHRLKNELDYTRNRSCVSLTVILQIIRAQVSYKVHQCCTKKWEAYLRHMLAEGGVGVGGHVQFQQVDTIG